MISITYSILALKKWVLPATFMFGTAPTFLFFWGGWRFLTMFLPNRIYEKGDDWLYSMYQRMVLFFYEHECGTEVILSGDVDCLTAKKENVILIMNHQCAVDWMIADMLGVRQGTIGHIRYVLKNELRYVPIYGFYFRQHSGIYVKRGGSFKQEKAIRQLDTLAANGTPFWMVIFPEGTRYDPSYTDKIEKSQQYAKKQGLVELQNLLTPRVKAMYLCRDRLKDRIDAIYDVTVAYSGTTDPVTKKRTHAPGLVEFLKGGFNQIHMHIDRIPLSEVPESEDSMKLWLHQRFAEKDVRLARFYSDEEGKAGTLCDKRVLSPLSYKETLPAFMFWSAFNIPLFATADGRAFYWRAALLGIVSGWVWISIRF